MEIPLRNTSLDDLCSVIGFTATVQIVMWLGGAQVYIPKQAQEKHFLANVIGEAAMRRLVTEFGDTTVFIPLNLGPQRSGVGDKKREIVRRLVKGDTPRSISEALELNIRLVQRVGAQAKSAGVFDALT